MSGYTMPGVICYKVMFDGFVIGHLLFDKRTGISTMTFNDTGVGLEIRNNFERPNYEPHHIRLSFNKCQESSANEMYK